ncbi:MAG: GTPase Era [Rickettsiales bacterium]|jgi:GTP-binding protein Era|nr:GTPase Era [Rickettsiales bacterium]
MKEKTGFISILGPTNAGKSTLMNAIMGRKVSIVSHKVQTTRTNLRAVKMVGGTQIIFTDTPGMFRPARRLDRAMVRAASASINDSDAILLMIDAKHGITKTIVELIEKVKDKTNVFAVVNKVDSVKKDLLLPIIAGLSEYNIFHEIFLISALKNDGVEKMLDSLAAVMPEAPHLFPAADAPDIPDALWLAEITREKVYKYLHQELPYDIFVATEKVDTDDEGVLEIYQKIVVKSDNHKKIAIGRGGELLGRIGTAARHEIQDEWGVNARLHLFVRVEPDWQERRENYEDQGLEFGK